MSASRVINLMLCFVFLHEANGMTRCFTCRSRGELGSCRDPFPFNVTQAEEEIGLNVVPCASGWCGKIMEGGNTFKTDDYGVATQRMCLQRGPSDGEERCAYTVWNHRKVYMCFCIGDLCNHANILQLSSLVFLIFLMMLWNTLT